MLTELDRTEYVDEMLIVRNGWVPRYEYRLTRIGQAEGEEVRHRLKMEDPRLLSFVEAALHDYRRSYAPMSISPHLVRRSLT